MPHDMLIVWLRNYEFWMLEGLFVAFAVTTALALPALVRSLRAGATWWAATLGLALVALALVWLLPPTTNRIFYDEQIYQDVGRNLADLRQSQTCHYGIVEYGHLQCVVAEYNKEPYGYPYLLSVAYRLFGVHEGVAHAVNRVSHALLVLLLAVTAVRWFGDRTGGLFAALAATLVPEQLRWAATAASEPTAALFCLIGVLATVEFCRARTTRALAWAVCALAFAVHLRPEAVLVLGIAGLIVITHVPDELRGRRLWRAAAAGGILLAPYVLHLLAVRDQSWGAPGSGPFAWAYAATNFSVNAMFYIFDWRFPGWLLPFAIAGAVAGQGPARARAVAATGFFVFAGIFVFFYAGSYDYGADVRYSLMTYPMFMLLTGLGLAAAARWLGERMGGLRARAAVAAALIWMFLLQAPYVRAVGEEAWGARADVAFARSVAADLPDTALVLTHDPNMFLVWGQNAAQVSLALNDPAFLGRIAGRHPEIYFHFGFWCNVLDPVQQKMCTDLLARVPHELVREQPERSSQYALYRLRPK